MLGLIITASTALRTLFVRRQSPPSRMRRSGSGGGTRGANFARRKQSWRYLAPGSTEEETETVALSETRQSGCVSTYGECHDEAVDAAAGGAEVEASLETLVGAR